MKLVCWKNHQILNRNVALLKTAYFSLKFRYTLEIVQDYAKFGDLYIFSTNRNILLFLIGWAQTYNFYNTHISSENGETISQVYKGCSSFVIPTGYEYDNQMLPGDDGVSTGYTIARTTCTTDHCNAEHINVDGNPPVATCKPEFKVVCFTK